MSIMTDGPGTGGSELSQTPGLLGGGLAVPVEADPGGNDVTVASPTQGGGLDA